MRKPCRVTESVPKSPVSPANLDTNAKPLGATELPRDVAAAHYAHHWATDVLLEDGPPRHQAEAESVVDHGETAAGEPGGSEKLAAHRLPLVDGPEGEAAFDLLARQGADEVGFDPQPAVGRPAGVPLPDQLV